MNNFAKVNLKEIDPREILGPTAHIYRSYLAYMAKELEAYRVGSGQFEFLLFLYHKDGVPQVQPWEFFLGLEVLQLSHVI